jgi:hypothetical protein
MLIKLDEISKKVAEKFGEKEHVIREINRSQWKLLHEKMQDGNLDPVKIMYIGKFSKKLKRNSDAIKRNMDRIQKSGIS